jgi:hypothetical protein
VFTGLAKAFTLECAGYAGEFGKDRLDPSFEGRLRGCTLETGGRARCKLLPECTGIPAFLGVSVAFCAATLSVSSRIMAKSEFDAEKLSDGSSGAPVGGAVRMPSDSSGTTVFALLLDVSSREKAGENVRLDSLDIGGRPLLGNAVAACSASARELDLGGVLDLIVSSCTIADKSFREGSFIPELYRRFGIGLSAGFGVGPPLRFADAVLGLPSENDERRGDGGKGGPLVTDRESVG